MATPLPIDPHAAVRKVAAGRAHHQFSWSNLVMFLFSLAALGWCFYHFYWQYRPPFERVLTDRNGNEIKARILDRRGGIVRYTVTGSDSVQLFPISFLSENDQAFVNNMVPGTSLSFPLKYKIKDAKGNPQDVSIEGQNGYFAKYFVEGDSNGYEISLDDLPALDRAIILQLPGNFKMSFPIDHTLTDLSGKTIHAHILGHSLRSLRYTLDGKAGDVHVLYTKDLSEQDTKMLEEMPFTFSDAFPIDWYLPLTAGAKQPVRLTGMTANLLRYALPGESLGHFQHFFAITDLPLDEQDYFSQFERASWGDLPMECALTDKNGHVLEVKLTARSSSEVKFTTRDDEKYYDYPMSNLSATDQDFIKTLPKAITDTADIPDISVEVQIMRKQFLDLKSKIADLTDDSNKPLLTTSSKQDDENQIKAARTQLIALSVAISDEYTKRIDELQKENIDLESKQLGADVSNNDIFKIKNQINKNTSNIAALKEQVRSFKITDGLSTQNF